MLKELFQKKISYFIKNISMKGTNKKLLCAVALVAMLANGHVFADENIKDRIILDDTIDDSLEEVKSEEGLDETSDEIMPMSLDGEALPIEELELSNSVYSDQFRVIKKEAESPMEEIIESKVEKTKEISNNKVEQILENKYNAAINDNEDIIIEENIEDTENNTIDAETNTVDNNTVNNNTIDTENNTVADDLAIETISNDGELSLVEMETIARYIFDLTDEYKWKECVCTIFAEGGCVSAEEDYNVTTAVLNEVSSQRYVAEAQIKSIYRRLTGGGFTAYQNSYYYNFFNMDLDSLRAYPGYEGIVRCLYSQKFSHNYAQFRNQYSSRGVQFVENGNKYLDPITDYIPLDEREYYQRFLNIINDENNALHDLLLSLPEDEMECLKYYYENNVVAFNDSSEVNEIESNLEQNVSQADQNLVVDDTVPIEETENILEGNEITKVEKIKRRILVR